MVIKMGPGGEGPSRKIIETHPPKNTVNEVRKEVVKKEVNNTSEWNCRIVTEGTGEETDKKVNPIIEFVTTTIDNYNKFAEGNLLPELHDVAAIGVSGDTLAVTGSVQVVIDKAGNVGFVFSGGFKGKTDIECGISVVGTLSYNMESRLYLLVILYQPFVVSTKSNKGQNLTYYVD